MPLELFGVIVAAIVTGLGVFQWVCIPIATSVEDFVRYRTKK